MLAFVIKYRTGLVILSTCVTYVGHFIQVECKWFKYFLAGTLTSEATVADVLDKGSGAVILLDGECVFQRRLTFIPHAFVLLTLISLFLKVNFQRASAGIEIMAGQRLLLPLDNSTELHDTKTALIYNEFDLKTNPAGPEVPRAFE